MAAFKATFKQPVGGQAIELPYVPLLAPYALDCAIDWGDGSPTETFVNYIVDIDGPGPEHLYTGGTYQMSITGKYRGWNASLVGGSNKLISIDHWGDNVISFSTGFQVFMGSKELVTLPTEGSVVFPPDCREMFNLCLKLKSGLDSVDTSNVTNMYGMFFFALNLTATYPNGTRLKLHV